MRLRHLTAMYKKSRPLTHIYIPRGERGALPCNLQLLSGGDGVLMLLPKSVFEDPRAPLKKGHGLAVFALRNKECSK